MDWINFNFSPSSHSFNDNWFDLWAFSCHQIMWILRNKRIHDLLFVMPLNPILDIQNYVWICRKSKQLLLKVNPIARNPISVHWNPPASGWVCLNLNGLLRLILVPLVEVFIMITLELGLVAIIVILVTVVVLMLSFRECFWVWI